MKWIPDRNHDISYCGECPYKLHNYPKHEGYLESLEDGIYCKLSDNKLITKMKGTLTKIPKWCLLEDKGNKSMSQITFYDKDKGKYNNYED